jgi:DNA-binding transcriptional LysR family regulator
MMAAGRLITERISAAVMSVELRDLRWALVAARHRSLRQAAEELNIRQSTLSRGLRDLEFELGTALFERTNGGTRPTIVGQEFLEAARGIVQETETIVSRLKTRSRGESGRLSVGVHASLSTGNLRATLIEHHRRFPEVELNLVDGSSENLISNLTNSSLDVAFVADGGYRWEERSLSVWSERVIVAVPTDHPLSARDVVHWHDLRDERLLLPERGPGQEFVGLLVSKLGCSEPCRFIRQDVSLDRLLTLVSSSLGLLLVLEGATGVSYPGVTFHEVHDAEAATRLGFRALWRNDNSNPSLRPLLDVLRERYPDLSAGSVA